MRDEKDVTKEETEKRARQGSDLIKILACFIRMDESCDDGKSEMCSLWIQ